MEDKMEGVAAAAKKACAVAERILPGRPHHLTLNPHRKYAPPSGFWFTGTSSRLQYLTNLSDVDRGMLLTVPFFEIIDEPEPAKPVRTSKSGEPKKKMSFKDYKAGKKSASPTENNSPAKPDAKQGPVADARTSNEKEKVEETKPKETNGQTVAKPDKARPELNGERAESQSKDNAKNSQTHDSRKRPPDPDENIHPQKKAKTADGSIHKPELARNPKSSAPRSQDAPRDRSTLKEPKDAREPKAVTPSRATNGRLAVPGDMDKDMSSPRSTIVVNGTHSRAGSSTSTPRKGEAVKASIPPLLSPPFQMNGGEQLPSPRKRPAGKAPLKGPQTGGHSRTNSATKPPIPDLLSPIHIGFDVEHDRPRTKVPEKSRTALPPLSKTLKRPKSRIPPLLSPTLPSIVEDDLARIPAPKPTPHTEKKLKPLVGPKPRPEKIVVLKYKKALKTRVQAILSLPSKSRRDALRKDRSDSVERTPPAKKRPLPPSEAVSEIPTKKIRPSAEVLPSKPPAPTTPLKHSATSMSRVLSNNSQIHTPGELHLTPSAAERPPTSSSHDNLDPATLSRSAAERDRHAKYSKLGTSLKRSKDAIGRGRPPAALSDSDNKRAAALHFEMVLAYMISFKAHNASRTVERKPLDISLWETLLPHFGELRMRVHRSRPLQALCAQVHGVCLEEFCQAFTSLDERSASAVYLRWVKFARKRREVWEEAHTMAGKVEDGKMRASNLGPWSSVEEAVSSALLVLRRWAVTEGVEWRPELDTPGS